ncbi:MAG: hypothetical protein M5U01_29900 [Ardenticatenaceae bacterium]|nr:hypothetical protein [Ardenticatenaceae bacterium]
MFRSRLTKGTIALVTMFLFGLFGAWGTQASQSVEAGPRTDRTEIQTQPLADQDAGNANPIALYSPDSTWTTCTPARVGVFTTRIHIKCAAAVGGIWYFAVATTDDAHAARVLSLLNTALVTGRSLVILYNPSDTTGGPPIGCAANDCRLLLALELY